MEDITETVTEICDLFIQDADPAFYPQLQLVKDICRKFVKQHPKLNTYISEFSYIGSEDVSPEFDQDFILQFRKVSDDFYMIITIKIYRHKIKVFHLHTKSVWTINGLCINNKTTDPVAKEHSNLKSYLFTLFSTML